MFGSANLCSFIHLKPPLLLPLSKHSFALVLLKIVKPVPVIIYFNYFFGHHFLIFFDLLGQCDNFQIEGEKEY